MSNNMTEKTLEVLFEELPMHSQVTVIGRYGGSHRKYEAKYENYSFTAYSPEEAMSKLMDKLTEVQLTSKRGKL